MDRRSIISGFNLYLPYADTVAQLIKNLRSGKRVELSPWFKSDTDAIKCGFNGNKYTAKLDSINDSNYELMYRLVDGALQDAMLNRSCLAGDNVRVYLTGIGPRVDLVDYRFFYDHNDIEDVALTPSIKNLRVSNMSQDTVSIQLAHKYKLKHVPPNLNCTSNSALTAIHLSCQAIEKGGIDLALIINISKIMTQDIWFLENQSMLDSEVVQPFGVNSRGVMFSEGYSVMLLESDHHRRARKIKGGVSITSAYTQINASRNYDSAWQSACMFKQMTKILKDTQVGIDELCALIPHGNGSTNSDNVEAKAISMLLGDYSLPVLAYKGQIGYTATGSGLVDLVIGHHCLVNNELITPCMNSEVKEEMARHFITDRRITQHSKQYLLKTGLGVDGSIISLMLANTRSDD